MKLKYLLALVTSLALGGWVPAANASYATNTAATPQESLFHDWIFQREDSVTGISDGKKISNPAIVDFDALMNATPQMKELRKEDIDPDSPEGKKLRHDARVLVTKTCQAVARAKGHCGVWKAIRHKDGRLVSNITAQVRERF